MTIARHEIPAAACPKCGALQDCATGPAQPKPGDFAVCFDCGSISRFGDDLERVALAASDFLDLDDDLRMKLARLSRRVIRYREANP